MVKVTEGFEFLGFKYKYHEGRGLLVTPSPESKKNFQKRIKETISKNQKVMPAVLIRELNPIIVGWANYYRVSSSTRTFTVLGHFL